MSLLDKMPLSFWEDTQNIFKKYKKGSMSLDDCFERQRELSLQQIEKIKNAQENPHPIQHQNLEKTKRAEAIFEKIKARSQKKKDELSTNSERGKQEVVKEKVETPKKVEKPSGKENFNCEECEKTGTSFSSNLLNVYENHIMTKHPHYKPFKCDKCSYTTHKKGNLNKHMRSGSCKGKEN